MINWIVAVVTLFAVAFALIWFLVPVSARAWNSPSTACWRTNNDSGRIHPQDITTSKERELSIIWAIENQE
jgi:hypothetical protein